MELTLRGVDKPEVLLSDEAYKLKGSSLKALEGVKEVGNQLEMTIAVEALKPAKSLLKQIEEDRKKIKAPILDLGRKIDAIASEFCEQITKESERVSSLIGKFQAEEENRVVQEVQRFGGVVREAAAEKGVYNKPTPIIEIEDIHLLYKTNPTLVRMEPNLQAIKKLISEGVDTIPGLKITWEQKAVVRT